MDLSKFSENPFEKARAKRKKLKWGDFPPEYVGRCYSIANRYGSSYKNEDLRDTMLQELFLVLDKLKKKDAEKFLIPAYVSKYLSMESRQIYARYQKGRHHLDIDGKENRLPHEPMLEVEDQIDRQEFINSIRAAIRHNLSDFEQWLVTERFLNSRTYKEILEEYNKGKDRTKRLKTISVFHSHVTAAVEKLRLVLKPIYMKHLKSIHNHDVVLEKEEAETPESGIFAIAAHLPYTCPEIPLE